jgi:hypothetical protein
VPGHLKQCLNYKCKSRISFALKLFKEVSFLYNTNRKLNESFSILNVTFLKAWSENTKIKANMFLYLRTDLVMRFWIHSCSDRSYHYFTTL